MNPFIQKYHSCRAYCVALIYITNEFLLTICPITYIDKTLKKNLVQFSIVTILLSLANYYLIVEVQCDRLVTIIDKWAELWSIFRKTDFLNTNSYDNIREFIVYYHVAQQQFAYG